MKKMMTDGRRVWLRFLDFRAGRDRKGGATTSFKISYWMILTALLQSGFLLTASAQPLSPTEYEVKAAFLYHFTRFFEWPDDTAHPDKPFVIGVLGEGPVAAALDEVAQGKKVGEKRLIVKRLGKAEEGMENQIVFISASEGKNLQRILKTLDQGPILTVSEIDRFPENGGMVNFIMEENKVRFAINVEAVERAGLKPSSQILKLAKIAKTGRRSGE